MTTNILQFPKSAIVRDASFQTLEHLDSFKEKGKKKYADTLVSELGEDIVLAIAAYGLEIEDEKFAKDFTLFATILEALVYRSVGIEHPAQKFLDEAYSKLEEEQEPVPSQ